MTKSILLSLAGLALLAPASPWLRAAPAAPEQPRVRILVKPKPGARESVVHSIFAKNRAHQHQIIHPLDVRVLSVPADRLEATLERLRRYRQIELVEPDCVLEPDAILNDTYYSMQWHLAKIAAPAAWDSSTGVGVTVAILDSGLDAGHPDLSSQLVSGWNFFDNNTDTRDVTGHGTGVAGAAGAAGNNGIGVAGVGWNCRLMPLRVSDTNGYASSSAIASALTWAADHGVRVANISYSGVTKLLTISNAAAYFQSKGGVVVASAGNTGAFDPAPINPRFLLVSGTDSSDGVASWSCTGSNIDLAAPGAGIVTTARGGGYGSGSGTSFAAPVVAGCVALMISANGALPATQLQNLIKQNADDLGAPGWDSNYGLGRVNASRAVTAAMNTAPADATAPTVLILSPSVGTEVTGNVTVAVSASDDVAVARVECFVDGTLLGSATSPNPSFAWNTILYPNGDHTLEARAYDTGGNVGLSSRVAVRVGNTGSSRDTNAPMVVINSPVNGSTVARTVKVSISATDNVGITRVDLYVDGNLYASSPSATPVFSWNTSKAAKGQHLLAAWAYDAAGNVGSSSTVAVRK